MRDDTITIEDNSRYTLTYQSENLQKEVVVSFDGNATLNEVVENLEGFICACGFTLPEGTYLAIVSDVANIEEGEDED